MKFAPQMKLLHKGVLIVALPLCLQTAFYLVLKDQLTRASGREEDLESSEKIVVAVNAYILELGGIFDVLATSCLFPDDGSSNRLARLIYRSKTRAEEISQMLSERAQEPVEAQRIKDLSAKLFNEAFVVEKGLTNEPSGISRMREFNASFRFKDHAKELSDYLTAIARREEEKSIAARRQGDLARQQIGLWLDVAASLNALVAVFLAFYFVRGTVQHLHVLKENARRLSANTPLLARIEGADEIAEVDRVFHEMADALKLAVDRENEMFKVLRASEIRLRSVINALPIALLTADRDGNIESMNPQAEKLFSRTSTEMRGKPLSDLLGTAQKGAEFPLQQLLKDSLSRSTPMEADSRGRPVPVEVSLSSFESTQGDRIIATVLDVTERQKLERMKSDFVAMVSHDIRTPLSSIRCVLEIASCGRLGEVSEEMEQQLTAAMSSADQLLALVKRLLDIEKLESGLVQLSPRSFSIDDLYECALPLVSQLAGERSIEIEMKNETESEAVADMDSIVQVLTNLLSNAIRYTEQNSTIVVTGKDEYNRIKISVQDAGPGIKQELQESLFERFKQLGDRSDRQGGFGLGLAICKSIVEQHGQSIGVESIEGVGSTFWFTLAKA